MCSICGSSVWSNLGYEAKAYLVRYIDDFVLCFQYREDALRVQDALRKRLGKFGLTLTCIIHEKWEGREILPKQHKGATRGRVFIGSKADSKDLSDFQC